MKIVERLPLLLMLPLFVACSNGMEEGKGTTTTPPPDFKQQPIQATQPSLPQTASSGTAAAGVNPPHGQPGHRCDISVGAPLNSPPSKPAVTTTAPQQQTVVMPQPTAPAAATKTAAGTNPPHGQPGHRCDIAVGAPLPK
nr:hypothetical protein [uncultured Lacibacter sp.]